MVPATSCKFSPNPEKFGKRKLCSINRLNVLFISIACGVSSISYLILVFTIGETLDVHCKASAEDCEATKDAIYQRIHDVSFLFLVLNASNDQICR